VKSNNFIIVKESIMLRWALGFLIISLTAAVLGFYGLAATAAYFAKIVFFIFLILSILSLIGSFFRKEK
jgi:uncharacterized membrane protein YtjA (UPF0391 family)